MFAELGSLPRQRYRHSASVVNNQLWLIGGRDASDALLAEVDVRLDDLHIGCMFPILQGLVSFSKVPHSSTFPIFVVIVTNE